MVTIRLGSPLRTSLGWRMRQRIVAYPLVAFFGWLLCVIPLTTLFASYLGVGLLKTLIDEPFRGEAIMVGVVMLLPAWTLAYLAAWLLQPEIAWALLIGIPVYGGVSGFAAGIGKSSQEPGS